MSTDLSHRTLCSCKHARDQHWSHLGQMLGCSKCDCAQYVCKVCGTTTMRHTKPDSLSSAGVST